MVGTSKSVLFSYVSISVKEVFFILCLLLLFLSFAQDATAKQIIQEDFFAGSTGPVPVRDFPKWEKMLERERAQPTFTTEGFATHIRAGLYTPKDALDVWGKLLISLQVASAKKKVEIVHTFFNQWKFREDKDNWGIEDYWATPMDFIAVSGDCEEYASIKYFALRSLGFSADKMHIIGLMDKKRQTGHAILSVKIGDSLYYLDNLYDGLVTREKIIHYDFYYFINENGQWLNLEE